MKDLQTLENNDNSTQDFSVILERLVGQSANENSSKLSLTESIVESL